MYGYDAVLSALRLQASTIVAPAQGDAQGDAQRVRLRREFAECVLRNRAKLILVRLQQTGNDAKRRQILRQALLGA